MKIAPNESQWTQRLGRSEPVVFFFVSEQMFAIAASAIHEIRSVDSISSSASEIAIESLPKVQYLLHRGREAYYVVNACTHFGLRASPPSFVLVLRNSRVCLLVDRIERMETMSFLLALPASFYGNEREWYRGLILLGESVVPVVSASGFLTQREFAQLDSVAAARASAPPENGSLRNGEGKDIGGETQGVVIP